MTYTSPITWAIKVQMQRCIAQSSAVQRSGEGLNDMSEDNVYDEDF